MKLNAIDKKYRPKYFKLKEIIPPELLHLGESAWELMDVRILWTADALRRYFGVPIIINGPGRTLSGLRPFNCPIGAELSQHKFGRALDMIIMGVPAEDARKTIRQALDNEAFQFITAIENNVEWLHVDCRYTGINSILYFTNH
jgi:hypothetical protein